MAKDKNEGISNSTQPSGPLPMEVVLNGSVIGDRIDSFENLVVNAISQLIYGSNSGKSKFKLGDIASIATSTNNPVSLLDSIDKKFDKIIDITNKLEKSQVVISNNIQLINKSLTDIFTNLNSFDNSINSSGNSDNVLSVILEGSNVDEVFNALAKIADDNVVYKLADAFKMLIDNSQQLNEFGNNIELFAKTIKNISETQDSFNSVISIIEMLSDKLTTLETSLTFENLDGFTNFANNIQSLSDINLENINLEAIKNFLTIINETSINEENINKFVAGLEALNPLQNINEIDNDKIVNTNITLLDLLDTVKYINDIPEITNVDNITNLITVLSNLSNINVDQLEKLKSITDQINNLDGLTVFLHQLSKSSLELSGIVGFGPLIKLGQQVLNSYVDCIVVICDKLQNIDAKKLKAAIDVMENITKLITISSICMIIGGAFIVFYPKLVLGALVFGLVLGVFILNVLAGINIASSLFGGIKVAEKILDDVAKLILVASFVMILGASFIIFFPKLVVGSIAFGLALGLFICVTIGAINMALWFMGGIKVAEHTLAEISDLIITSTFIMVLGAVFMMIPGMWANAFKFTTSLALFIFSILGSISLAAKNIKESLETLKDFTKIIIVSTFIMVLGAVFMAIPTMAENALLFTAILDTFIYSTLKAIKRGSKSIFKYFINAEIFKSIVIVSAATLLAGGMLFIIFPDLAPNVILFGTIMYGFVLLMSKAMETLANNDKNILKGTIALTILSGAILIISTSMVILRKAVEGASLDVLAGVGLMSLIIIATAGIALGLGAIMNSGVGAVVFGLGIVALGSIVVIVGLASLALMGIAKSMDMFSKVKRFDAAPIVANIISFASIIPELAIFGILSPIIISASLAITSLSICISNISESVQEAASLKIPIYEGTKKVGYRKLKNKDFVTASKNITSIITILGKTILDIYKKSPSMFSFTLIGDNPFTRVIKSTTGISTLISKLSNAIKNYADLKIAEYSGNKIVKYRHLEKSDFKSASENIQTILQTLSLSLIELYNNNKNIYDDHSVFSFITGDKPGNTPLSRVITVSMKLGKLVSKIAKGVQDIANLRIPKYDSAGKVVGYEKMNSNDISKAGENVKEIINILTTSLIDLYNENKEMYSDNKLFGISAIISGHDIANTPLSRVIAISLKLGKLISKIAKGVQDIANLRIAKYDSAGKVVGYEKMNNNDIPKAAENVKEIINILTTSLIDLYNENKEMYSDNSLFSFMTGDKPGNTPLSRVISVSLKMGNLISKVAKGVQSMANLKIAKYDSGGKIIGYENMNDTDILKSAINTKNVISVLGNALMKSYEEHSDWYDGNIKKTPFFKVLSVNMNLSKLISNIGDSISKMAKLQIPYDYDKNGKAIKFRSLEKNDFINAGQNIGEVIKTLARTIKNIYDKNKDLFTDDKKSPFSIIMNSSSNMGTLLSSLAEGIKNYSNLQIPDQWDPKTGKPIHFRQLTDQDFININTNISSIISTLGESIMNVYNNPAHEDWFKNGGNWFKKTDSPFTKTLNGCIAMGDMISSISEGIITLSKLQIPIDWDKTGKPIKFMNMIDTDFTKASANIKTIVETIGGALITTYNNNTSMFEGSDSEDTPFNKIAQGCSYLGELVKNIAEGVVEMATIEQTLSKQGIKFDENTYNEAGQKIAKVVSAIGGALITTFNGHKDWFENPPLKKGGLDLGIISLGVEEIPNTADTPFQKIMNSSLMMGQLIISIAQGISFFASITQKPIDKNGNKLDIDKATTNIENILTAIGNAIVNISSSPRWFSFESTSNILSSIIKTVNALTGITNILSKIGSGKITTLNKNGEIISEILLDKPSLAEVSNTISDILTAVSGGLDLAMKSSSNYEFDIFNEKTSKKLNNILTTINTAIGVVGKNADLLASLGNHKMKYTDSEGTEQVIDVSSDKLTAGGDVIKSVIESIITGLSNAFDSDVVKKLKIDKIQNTINLINDAIKVISDNVNILGDTASLSNYEICSQNIENIMKNIIDGIKHGTDSASSLFGNESDFSKTKAFKVIKMVNSATEIAKTIAKSKSSILELQDFKYYDTMNPIIEDISKVFDSLNNIGENKNIFARIIGTKMQTSPLHMLFNDIDTIISQCNEISATSMDESYKTLNKSITSIFGTISNVSMSESFGNQVNDLSDFIKNVNNIEIDGIDSLTELIRELNNMGINMGNLDKLANAISSKLSVTLQKCSIVMKDLNNTMRADWKRKDKHKKDIKTSIDEIQRVINNPMNVIVKMDDSNSTSVGDTGPINNDTNGSNVQGGGSEKGTSHNPNG